jgi:hypothetical protein
MEYNNFEQDYDRLFEIFSNKAKNYLKAIETRKVFPSKESLLKLLMKK